MSQYFTDRRDAGRRLAALLDRYREQVDTLLVALPRGGVPVAAEVARHLDLPLDLCIVRKLGVPWNPELAMGAIGPAGARVLNRELIQALAVSSREVERVIAAETLELERRLSLYTSGRTPFPIAGQQVIVVDDGIATGSTMEAAIQVLRAQGAARVVVAAGVVSAGVAATLAGHADDVVSVLTPSQLYSIGDWYLDFTQTSDDDVRQLLREADTRWQSTRNPDVEAGRTGASPTLVRS